jgi:hypothetical protein
MIPRPARFVVGLAVAAVAASAEPPATPAPVSPVRQYLRDSLKAKVPSKPAETPLASEAKPPENPIVMPAFVVTESREKQERRALQIVEGQKAMEERLSYHPLYKNDRIEVLRRPRMDDLPTHDGMDRLRVDILNLKW